MHSPFIRQASQACCHGCFPTPLCGLPEHETTTCITTAALSRHGFEVDMASSFNPNSLFTNHESLPSLRESYLNFTKVFPQYYETERTDLIREQEYGHLSISNHVCLDYNGHGLFSYSQQQSHCQAAPVGMTTSPFFDICYKAVGLNSQLRYGGQESELEDKIRKRIIQFMNISGDDYIVVFTANQSSAFKLLAESYPFESNTNLLTVYDHKSEAVEVMIKTSKKKGARPTSAEFLGPSLEIQSGKLLSKVVRKSKRKKGGLFVFPLQSRMTGARYPYLWMRMAQENGWHVLLDACALGPKDMETLGLSLFRPDFLICSFFKVFGENPSGFGCLFVKKSSASIFKNSANAATSIGIVRLVPPSGSSQQFEESAIANIKTEGNTSSSQKFELYENQRSKRKQKAPEIEELVTPPESSQSKTVESGMYGDLELECRGLDHADSLGLILITARTRLLINWLVNALMSLQHPNGVRPVRIYGPKVKFNRGPAVAFNVFDWKGEKIDPAIVQKLADRKKISLCHGFLQHIRLLGEYEDEREQISKARTSEEAETTLMNDNRDDFGPGISVVTATVGLLTNFEDVYRLWEFVSMFLDADFVEKEKWRYIALNQQMVEI
uniref:Uncharacterized protein LOC105128987 n=1 Tax=Rhizophora mucronata TaxID=61149 RepID=A0A2P2KXH1_RHIMU